MLLDFLEIRASQQQVVAAAGLTEAILTGGARVDQLAEAVSVLAPGHVLVGRYESSVEQLVEVVRDLQLPACVEWQGDFRDRVTGREFSLGHYSVITGATADMTQLYVVDPDAESLYLNGTIGRDAFRDKWWVDNMTPAEDGRHEMMRGFGLFFLVVPAATMERCATYNLSRVDTAFVRRYSHQLPPQ